jgi:transposase
VPKNYLIIGLKSIHVERVEEKGSGEVFIYGSYRGPRFCPHCESKRVQSRGWRVRTIKHSRMGNRIVEVRLKVRKLKCVQCLRQSIQRVQHVKPRRRSSENYRMEVYEQHLGGITQKQLSRTHRISGSTVERWFWDFLNEKYKELRGRTCPQVLGIDEHFFTRKQGYATTFVDLKSHRVFDVALGRSAASLDGYLKRLNGREQVKVVVMDLSASYRSIVQKYFPNAKIVADRFHVVRLVSHHFVKLWGQVDPEGRKNRGLVNLFRSKRENLSPKQLENFARYLKKIPALEAIDGMQQRLLAMMRIKHVNRRKAVELIPSFLKLLDELKTCGIEQLQGLGATLESWSEEIVRMWRFTKTNSITEGLHNHMEMISRRAFGFRNFHNYRLRVIVLCGHHGLFNRIDL